MITPGDGDNVITIELQVSQPAKFFLRYGGSLNIICAIVESTDRVIISRITHIIIVHYYFFLNPIHIDSNQEER